MLLCLDVGNSQVYGAVFDDNILKHRFRHSTRPGVSADEIGIFLRNVLRENEVNPSAIDAIAICSVVPNFDYAIRHACRKYFDVKPFILQAGVKTGLKIKYRNPLEVGADRIATAIAACERFPERNRVIVDFGTATTFCVVNESDEYLGGVIMPGLKLSMEALQEKTAKLPSVEIVKPATIVGRSTQESLQIGLYYAQHAAVKAITAKIQEEHFASNNAVIIGTGGLSQLFSETDLFTVIEPDLVLYGLQIAHNKNYHMTTAADD